MKQRIYIFSPSSAVSDKSVIRRGAKRLEALGYEVELDEAVFARDMRFAGDDDTRLAAIHRAAASGADLALISRGGYGLTRVLPRIKYKQVAKAIDKGLKFVGHSDFTAFQLATFAETGRVTWQGPALGEDFGGEGEPDDIAQACFEDLASGQGEGTGWQLPRSEMRDRPFAVDGTLWGGNLAMIASLVGTQWLPKVKRGILFLEDIGEHPYRVERMLAQLAYAGVLQSQKAIVFGQFTNYRLAPHDRGFKLQTVIDWLRTQVKAPVFSGLPFGHVATKVVLPVGAHVEMAVDGRDAFVVWGHRH
ncbi:MAG TPA: LD-carboxypeptidase [Ramlibacter sp.]|nr:LD-carboxypeptidase [Ramlibacter sp.]